MRLLILIALFLVGKLALAQKEITWEHLKCDSIVEEFNEEYGLDMLQPVFSKEAKTLDGDSVSITGYFFPIDLEEKLFVLSPNKYRDGAPFLIGSSKCPLDQIIQLKLNDDARLKITNFKRQFTFSGTLLLNESDPTSLFYILKDAKVVH